MINLIDWTIVKRSDEVSYIIGVDGDDRIIHTTNIYKFDYLHNDFVIVLTENSYISRNLF